ncbi:MAG: ABC transporter substrate-binding protein [Dehalococcoidales bacterium]|nr:ABC transporter substrate-binding protein [Dehalococcoidales bacterium]
MKKFIIILVAVAVIGALIFSGCTKATTTTTQGQTSTTTKTTSTTLEAPHKVLKIGSVIGLNSPAGIETKKWLDLFAKLINEQGGWKIGADTYDVDMIIYDSQSDPSKGKSYLEKLVLQDGVKFIIGGLGPTGNPATDAEVTEPNKVIVLGLDLVGNSADPNLQYYYTPDGMFFCSGYVYVICNDMQAKGMKTYASLKSDDMGGHFMDGVINKAWAVAAPNVQYTETVFYAADTSDFGPVATKLMSLDPDVIDCTYTGAGAALYNALYDAGYKGIILPSLDPTIFEPIRTHCGNAFMEGWETITTDPKDYPNQPQEILDLIDAYIAEYGEWQSLGCTWSAPWFFLKDAIDNTQSVDVEVIKAYLDNAPHPIVLMSGSGQFFARPEAGNYRTISGSATIYTAIMRDGKLVPDKLVTSKDNYLSAIMGADLVEVYKAYWEEYGYPTFPAGEISIFKFSDLGIIGQD